MEEFQNNGASYLLQPFIHQVGGHSSMLCLDDITVCKPIMWHQEKQFYETIPESLKKFVPLYFGTVKVDPIQEGDYIILFASKPSDYIPKPSKSSKQVRLRKNGSFEVQGVSAMFESDPVLGEESVSMNPWVLKCHREYISKLIMGGDGLPLNFIVLENLTWRFSLPCVLDLKMGTKQHGDNACLEKRQSKMFKVVTTTTAKLGVRVGGMQVYQASTGKFLCRNKLYGRSLSVAGFHNAMRSFLHDGTRLRTEVLPPLIHRLEELQNTLSHLESLRLFTSSLLLLYEGRETNIDVTKNGASGVGDQRKRWEESVDQQRDNSHRDTSNNGVAGGSFQGDKQRFRTSSVDEQSDSFLFNEKFRSRSASCNPAKKLFRPVEAVEEEPLTDVRIIDFAHSTHRGMDESNKHSGPDTGFLFGLTNVIKSLKTIQMDTT